LDAGLTILHCKKVLVAKLKEIKNGWTYLAASSKKCYNSERAVLLMIMMMMIYYFTAIGCSPRGRVPYTDTDKLHTMQIQNIYVEDDDDDDELL
jgi:hypothetical protein